MYHILVKRNNVIVQMYFCSSCVPALTSLVMDLSGSIIWNKPSPFRVAFGHVPYHSKRNPKTNDIRGTGLNSHLNQWDLSWLLNTDWLAIWNGIQALLGGFRLTVLSSDFGISWLLVWFWYHLMMPTVSLQEAEKVPHWKDSIRKGLGGLS